MKRFEFCHTSVVTRLVVIAVVALILPSALAYGAGDGKVYWSDRELIQRANIEDGTAVEKLLAPGQPAYIGLDLTHRHIYWSDQMGEEVMRSDFDGSNTVSVLDVLAGGVALDVAGNKIYLTDQYTGDIQRANLDGSGLETLLTGFTDPRAITLDVAGGKMYWTDIQDGTIHWANLNGTGAAVIVGSLDSPSAIALDTGRGKMYWADPSASKIQRANLDGSGVEDVISPSFPVGIALDTVAQQIYWTEHFSMLVRRCNYDGSSVETLVDTQGSGPPGMIALDVPGGKMYWSDPEYLALHRADLNGSLWETVFRGIGETAAIALDPRSDKMYWTDYGLNEICRSNLDGSGVEVLVSGAGQPLSVGIDTTDNRVYWTSMVSGEILSADLDGANVEVVIDGYEPYGLALDVVGRQLYFSDYSGMILRASESTLEIDTLVAGSSGYVWIALDIPGGKMYWTEEMDGEIHRADLDGKNAEQLLSGLSGPCEIELDVKGGKMYWAEYNAGKIVRADLDGGNVEDLVTGLDGPLGLALDPDPLVPTLLQSFAAAATSEGVEIQWRLSEASAVMRFFVLRADAGRTGAGGDAFYPLMNPVISRSDLDYRVLDSTGRPGGAYRYRIDVNDEDGRRTLFETDAVTVPSTTAMLHQNCPNPFNPETVIRFDLPERTHVKIVVYDVEGRLVKTLVDGMRNAGRGEVVWKGVDNGGNAVASGVYFYRISTREFTQTRRMLLLK